VVWKPSERCPSSAMLLAKCFYQADFPPGVFSVIHGGPTAVDKLLSQPEVKAVSFVGSDGMSRLLLLNSFVMYKPSRGMRIIRPLV